MNSTPRSAANAGLGGSSGSPMNGSSRRHIKRENGFLPLYSTEPTAIKLEPLSKVLARENEYELRIAMLKVPRPPVISLKDLGAEGMQLIIHSIKMPSKCAKIKHFEIFHFASNIANAWPKNIRDWVKVGDVPLMCLPIDITLTMFTKNINICYVVRAIDIYNRPGEFCLPKNIFFKG